MAGILDWLRPKAKKHTGTITEEQIKEGPLPVHVAIIMDGNGRWARRRALPRIAGHKAGADSIRDIVRFCGEIGVRVLTLYAFSTENWNRPKEEVEGLMDLLLEYLARETEELHENGVRLKFLGSHGKLRTSIQEAIHHAEDYTRENTQLLLNIAVNYGSRQEILRAVRQIAEKYKNGEFESLERITEETLADHLDTAGMPDPDLLIRPGQEMRLSNFLLWQSAYSEFWSTEVLWPDFRRSHMIQAIADFQKRERRFGAVSTEAGDRQND